MKVLITGGAGYIGSHLVEALVLEGASCFVVDDLSRGLSPRLSDQIDFAQFDLSDYSVTSKFFSGHSFDFVFHLAGLMQARESSLFPGMYHEKNVKSTINLCKALRGNTNTKLVFSSSCSVYGNNSYATESSSFAPLSEYAKNKIECENILHQHFSNRPENLTIFRFFNVIGSSLNKYFCDIQKETLLPSSARLILQGKSPKIFGTDFQTRDGSALRNFIDVQDVVSALLLPIKSSLSGIHNLTSGRTNSVLEVLEKLIIVSSANHLRVEVLDRRPEDPTFINARPSKQLSLLGWKTKIAIDESILNFWKVFQDYYFNMENVKG